MSRKYFTCECTEPFHELVVDKDEFGVYFFLRMKPYLPWYKRLILAVSYVLGKDHDRYDYSETILTKEKTQELISFICTEEITYTGNTIASA